MESCLFDYHGDAIHNDIDDSEEPDMSDIYDIPVNIFLTTNTVPGMYVTGLYYAFLGNTDEQGVRILRVTYLSSQGWTYYFDDEGFIISSASFNSDFKFYLRELINPALE